MVKPLQIDMPDGRLYAIGDIHGCRDELELLLAWLEEQEEINQDDRVIFIGDYLDRGYDCRGVVDLLIEFKANNPTSLFLKGNHEDMFLGYLGLGGEFGDVCLKKWRRCHFGKL